MYNKLSLGKQKVPNLHKFIRNWSFHKEYCHQTHFCSINKKNAKLTKKLFFNRRPLKSEGLHCTHSERWGREERAGETAQHVAGRESRNIYFVGAAEVQFLYLLCRRRVHFLAFARFSLQLWLMCVVLLGDWDSCFCSHAVLECLMF